MNERDYLQDLSRATPQELADEVLHADAEQERVLRIVLGDEQFNDIRAIATRTIVRGGAAKPKRGNVVVLHGIMGGELSEYGVGSPSLIWMKILKMITGAFSKLVLDDDGNSASDVRQSGIYLRYYASLLVRLNEDWNVRPFFYDWRRDIRLAAADLNTMLCSQFSNQPVHLVAHSMGGLVARSFIKTFPDRWNVPGADGTRGNLVMLGTPNYGSFAIPRMLFGGNEVMNMIAKIDIHHDPVGLLQIAKTFTGTYQMMPVLGHIEGLDLLYRSQTYNLVTVTQKLLDDAQVFQAEITSAIDITRMAYVAGYNRLTAAAIKDSTQLGSDKGYTLTTRGDGTVPHDLGLIKDVPTFYVDEEHMKLPANERVQAALGELLATCNLASEQYLWKGLGPEFDGQRGGDAIEDQQVLQAAESSRRAIKEQQAAALTNLVLSRGAVDSDTVSVEEQALADLVMEHAPLRISVAGQPLVSESPRDVGGTYVSGVITDGSDTSPSGRPQLPRPVIRVHVVAKPIEDVGPADATGPGYIDSAAIDCITVGHYLRVRPTGAERSLDIAISAALKSSMADKAPDEDAETLLNSFHQRGVLRGDLGVPFFLPDPRPGHEGVLIAIAGMGPSGQFGGPEVSLLARELCWSVAQLGKKHLATVLIGASISNLSFADVIHGWLAGLRRVLSNSQSAENCRLEAITFFTKPGHLPMVVNALQREKLRMDADKSSPSAVIFDMDSLPKVDEPVERGSGKTASTIINLDFDPSGVYRFSAMTSSASIPERIIRLDPRRVTDSSARLMSTDDPVERYKLGKFLLDFLFPRDLRSQLTGSAPVILQLNNDAAKVYWELAAQPLGDDDPVTAAGEMPYLGLQRGLTRQLRMTFAPPPEPPPPTGRSLRVLIVADGNRQARLPGAQIEAQRLIALFDRINSRSTQNHISYTALVGPSKATTLDVLLNINDQPPFDVLHYAGHCVYDVVAPGRSGFLFSDDDRLTADDLNQVDRTPKFVFANACESGIMPSRPDLSSPELPATFAEAFFQKGVANFICTAWPISDAAGTDFAEELYRQLLGDGTPAVEMYEALRAARQRIYASQSWGAYQHYGDPYFRLMHSDKKSS
jgi:pimeloyl-ACP methyl ester carboxylesterase